MNNFMRVAQFRREDDDLFIGFHDQMLVSLYNCASHRNHEQLFLYEYSINEKIDEFHVQFSTTTTLYLHIRMHVEISNVLVSPYFAANIFLYGSSFGVDCLL